MIQRNFYVCFLLVLLCGTVLFSGCATGYKSKGLRGRGFSDTNIQDNIFQVSFRGNTATDSVRAEDFTLLKCAELTLEKGYKVFVVLDKKFDTKITESGGQPIARYTIECFKEAPENQYRTVYDAEQVARNLKQQYELD
jgi:hypothetical protein